MADARGTIKASALKRGRNPKWPYVPVTIWTPADGSRGYTSQIRGKAFATRAEAVAYAEQHIEANDEANRRLQNKAKEPKMYDAGETDEQPYAEDYCSYCERDGHTLRTCPERDDYYADEEA